MKKKEPELKDWTENKAVVAEQIVLEVATSLIRGLGEKVTFNGIDWESFKGSIATAKVEAVFKWIVKQTKGFRIPVMVNFSQGDAPLIGMCFVQIGTAISNKFYGLNKELGCIPAMYEGWHNGPHSPYIMISDMFHRKGNQGFGLEGVKIIDILGEFPPPTFSRLAVKLADIS
ncbi:MAG: hypothetical protein NTY04_04050 [Candidatus Staskawiczbacteria bacterium]|nr:hypothetical protein [Candidatus Staskawiczbacteria bacterium]